MTTEPWITIAALAALAGAGSAQQPPAARPDQARPQEASVRPFELFKLDKVVGLEVRGAENKVVGQIDDLILDSNDGAVEFIVLSSGGVAGIGDKKRMLPWREVEWNAITKDGEHRCEARVSLSEEQVKGLREFDKKAAKKGEVPADGSAAVPMLNNTCTNEVKGHKVLDDANQDVGSIDEVVIDTMGGRVAYVVLAVGGTLGLGEKRYPLPWSALRVHRDGDELVIHANVTKERLKSAPEFDRSKWEAMVTPDWVGNVYTYYSVNPYWSGARPASSPKDKDNKDKK